MFLSFLKKMVFQRMFEIIKRIRQLQIGRQTVPNYLLQIGQSLSKSFISMWLLLSSWRPYLIHLFWAVCIPSLDTKLSRHNQNVVELKHYTRVVLDMVLNICFFCNGILSLPLILFITFKAIASPGKLPSNSQPKYVTFEYCLILASPYIMSKVPIFAFSDIGREKIDLVLPSPK